ncbi:hypothetical protein PPERSA_06371 [Pseudocohnilembus persalinus]|uniref:Uncharacterized protein n=1 Tax=Pseudocohnilembus persalinus TaxID=266149 RepID=A0A0V0QJK4_PSEPJ|nr:hypothetical protein PPERSA_06371 [Pseudocohnilembus persalinus]|eukprot:KRX02176.1 hypothetical protein PPERSA_06371 [Pseudocohnilembus persalinus]
MSKVLSQETCNWDFQYVFLDSPSNFAKTVFFFCRQPSYFLKKVWPHTFRRVQKNWFFEKKLYIKVGLEPTWACFQLSFGSPIICTYDGYQGFPSLGDIKFGTIQAFQQNTLHMQNKINLIYLQLNFQENDEDRDYYTKNLNRQDEKLEIIRQWKGQYDYDRDNIITIDKDKNVEKDVKKKLLLQKQRIKFEKDLTNLSEWIYQYSQIQDELREHQEKRDKSMDKKLKDAQDKFINAFEDKLRDLEEYRNEKQKLQNFIKDLNLRIEESQDNKTTENLKQYIAEAQYIINNLDKEKQFKDNLQNIIIRNKEEQKKPKSQQEYDQLQQGINEAIEKQQDFEKDRQLKIQLNNLLKEEQKKQDETSTKDLEKLNQIQKKKQILVAELKQLYNWRQNQYEQEEKVEEIQKRLKLEEDPIQKAKIQKELELRKTKGKELEQWKKERKKYLKKLIVAQNNLDEANSQEQKSEQDIEKLENEIINIQGKIRKLDNNRKEHSYQLLFDSIDQKLNLVGEDIVMVNVLETIQKEAKQFQAQQKDLEDDENDLNKVIKDTQRNIEKGLDSLKQNRQQITEIVDQKEKKQLEDDIIKINKKIEETKPQIKEFAEDLVDLDLYFANKDYWEVHLRNGRYLLALSKDAEEKKFLDGLVKLSLEKVKEIEDQRLERKELKQIGKQARNILASEKDAKSRQLAKEDEKTVNLGLQVLQNIIKKQCEYERELEEIKNLHRMERKGSEKLIKEKEIIQLNQKIQQLMQERRKQRQERNKKREEVLLMIQKRKEEEERKKLEEEKKKREEEEKRKKEEEEKKQRREQRRLIRKQAEQENQRRQNTFRKEKEGLIQQLKKLIETRDGNGKAKTFESKLSSFQQQLIKTRIEMAKIAKEKEKIEAKIDGFRDKQRQLEQKMDGSGLGYIKNFAIRKGSWLSGWQILEFKQVQQNISYMKNKFFIKDWAEQVVKYREILMQNQPILEQAKQLAIEEKTLHDDIINLEELIRQEAQLKENEALTIEQIEKIKKQKEAFEREAAKFQPQIDELENELLKYHTEDLQLEPLIEIETQQDVIN